MKIYNTVTALLLLSVITCTAWASSTSHPNNPCHYRWFPLEPLAADSMQSKLAGENLILLELPGFSALKIVASNSSSFRSDCSLAPRDFGSKPHPITVFQLFLTGAGPRSIPALVQADPVIKPDGSMEIPITDPEGATFAVQSSPGIQLNFFRLAQIPQPGYWTSLQEKRPASYTSDSFRQQIQQYLEILPAFAKKQIRQLLNSKSDPTTENNRIIDAISREILLAGRLFYREDTKTTEIELNSPVLMAFQEPGYLISNAELTLTGPAMINLVYRLPWPDQSISRIESPIRISLDSIPTWDDVDICFYDPGYRRKITTETINLWESSPECTVSLLDESSNNFSFKQNQHIYIPSGKHALQIQWDDPVWSKIFKIEFAEEGLLFQPGSKNQLLQGIDIENQTGLDLIRMGRKNKKALTNSDVMEIQHQLLTDPASPFLQSEFKDYRNISTWKTLIALKDSKVHIDTPTRINPINQPENIEPNSLPGKKFYQIPAHREFFVDVPGDPSELIPMSIIDPEIRPGDAPLNIWVDGQPYFVNETMRPIPSSQLHCLLKPGQHLISIESSGRSIFLDQSIKNQKGNPGWIRVYYRSGSTEKDAAVFEMPTEGYCCRLRILVAQVAPLNKELQLWVKFNGHDPSRVRLLQGSPDLSTGFYLQIPPNTSNVSVWNSQGQAWLNVSAEVMPGKNICQKVQEDRLMEMNDFFNGSLMWDEILKFLNDKDVPSWKRVYLLIVNGDLRSATDLFLHTKFDSNCPLQGLLYMNLMLHGGSPLKAYKIGEDLNAKYELNEIWFYRWMAEAAFRADKPWDALNWAKSILNVLPDDPGAMLMKANIYYASGLTRDALMLMEKVKVLDPGMAENAKLFTTMNSSVWLIPPEDWALQASEMSFYEVPEDQITAPAGRIFLGDEISAGDGQDDDQSRAYYLLNSGQELSVQPNSSGILRIGLRCGVPADQADIFGGSLIIQQADRAIYYPLLNMRPDRPGLFFQDNRDLTPSMERDLFIPLKVAGDSIRIRVEAGSIGLRIRTAAPCIRTNCADRQNNLFHVASDVLKPLEDKELDAEKVMKAVALIHDLERKYPGNPYWTHWRKFYSNFIEWHKLYSIPVSAGSAVLNVHETPSRLMQLRSAQLKQIPWTWQPDVLPPDSEMKYDISMLRETDVLVKIAGWHENTPVDVDVLAGNAVLATLNDRNLEYVFSSRLTTESILTVRNQAGGNWPVKIVAGYQSKKNLVPLNRLNMRNITLVSKRQKIQHQFIGPGALKIRFRDVAGGDLTGTKLRIQLQNSRRNFHEEQIVELTENNSCFNEDDAAPDRIWQVIIPTLLDGPYQVFLELVDGPDKVACEIWGAVFKVSEGPLPVVSLPLNFSSVEKPVDVAGTSTAIDWKSPVPKRWPLRKQAGGTWAVLTGYRSRNRDLSGQEIDTGFYEGEGYQLELTYLRRLEGKRIFLESALQAVQPRENGQDPIVRMKNRWTMNTQVWDLRTTGFVTGSVQDLEEETAFSIYGFISLKRSFEPFTGWHIIPEITGFLRSYSLDTDDLQNLTDDPDPIIYDGFNARHDTGVTLGTMLRYDFMKNVYGFTRMEVMSSGEEDSGIINPYWLSAGFSAMTGPVQFNLAVQERDFLGNSTESSRTRLVGDLSLYHWQGAGRLWEFTLSDRYTFNTNLNDLRVAVRVFFSAGRLLRDFDPFKISFKRAIESRMN